MMAMIEKASPTPHRGRGRCGRPLDSLKILLVFLLLPFALLASRASGPVLFASNGFTTDTAAAGVYGQPGFTQSGSGTSDTAFSNLFSFGTGEYLSGIAFDARGRMYYCDNGNNRVLVFDDPANNATADTVIGQVNFTGNAAGTSDTALRTPSALAFDAAGRLFLVDAGNNRVLVFDDPANDTTADTVVGQKNFTDSAFGASDTAIRPFFDNGIGFEQTSSGIVFDAAGRMYLSDGNNSRILVFNDPANDTTADTVIGQKNFTDNANNAASDTTMVEPRSIALDAAGRLYVADAGNNRILVFDDPSNDTTADTVIGQVNFTATGSAVGDTRLSGPSGIAFDTCGRLYVADRDNHRVLVFSDPANDTTARTVLGQPNFTTNVAGGVVTAINMNRPTDLALDATGRLYVVDAVRDRIIRFDPLVSVALPVSSVVNTDSRATVNAPVGSGSDTFVQINMSGGSTTSGTLVDASDTAGTNADYVETTALVNPGDTLVVYVWTDQSRIRLFLGLRSDTATLNASLLPGGIPNTQAGLLAFGASLVSIEFGDSTGAVIGDSVTTSSIGETFAYTLVYHLSQATARRYHDLGFDTSPGSGSFHFYYADTYGGAWTRDASVTVSVEAGQLDPAGLTLRIAKLTRDLPGGLGGAPASAAASGGGSSGCALVRAETPSGPVALLRRIRDLLLAAPFGRFFTAFYYLLVG